MYTVHVAQWLEHLTSTSAHVWQHGFSFCQTRNHNFSFVVPCSFLFTGTFYIILSKLALFSDGFIDLP